MRFDGKGLRKVLLVRQIPLVELARAARINPPTLYNLLSEAEGLGPERARRIRGGLLELGFSRNEIASFFREDPGGLRAAAK